MLELFLVLLCFIVTFVYNKKEGFVKRFFRTFLSVFYVFVTSLFFSASFASLFFDLSEKYHKPAMALCVQFFQDVLIVIIPLIYIAAVLVLIKNDKKDQSFNGLS